jgi:CxxC motif-containing protein (DUF1111 family)
VEDLVMRRNELIWLVLGLVAFVAAAVLLLGWQLFTLEPARNVHREMVLAGRELFHHEWEPGDSLSPQGDGLGPVFNARSCVACHNQGGSGGSGSLDHNVISFSVRLRNEKPREGVLHACAIREDFQERLSDIHPDFPDFARSELIQSALSQRRGRGFVGFSQVNTPALFGSGLIDALPDRVLIAEEARQQSKLVQTLMNRNQLPRSDDESAVGRVSRLPDGRIGKFGWKGQTASLSEFVQAACANELGLDNPNHPQPRSLHKPDYTPPGLDLTQQQCDQLTAFVASLDRPKERVSADFIPAVEGKLLFGKIGCADCHVPNLGGIDGIYSDLLLHRMSPELVGAAGYRGETPPAPSSDPSGSPDPSEWRTPPLWGVADSAPYLHDGRAATLEEAIKLHGGQAVRSAMRFNDLKEADQKRVVAFLKTLGAP